MVDWHLKAARQQLRQLATAFRLALALNRTLILPQVGPCTRCAAAAISARYIPAAVTGAPACPASCQPPTLPVQLHAWQFVAGTGLNWTAAAGRPAWLNLLTIPLPPSHPPTLSAPQLFAWCDRYWAELDHCRIPGADNTGLPFVAPLDHFAGVYAVRHTHRLQQLQARCGAVQRRQERGRCSAAALRRATARRPLCPRSLCSTEPAGLGADANAGADHGPAISFREHSFLHNPRTPTSLLVSELWD